MIPFGTQLPLLWCTITNARTVIVWLATCAAVLDLQLNAAPVRAPLPYLTLNPRPGKNSSSAAERGWCRRYFGRRYFDLHQECKYPPFQTRSSRERWGQRRSGPASRGRSITPPDRGCTHDKIRNRYVPHSQWKSN